VNQRVILRPLARARKVACAVVSATFMCLVFAIAASSEPVQAAPCSGSLQAKIDAAPVGGTVRADACIYREQLRITKPITLIGQEGAEIRGSDIWASSAWTKLSSGDFKSSKTLPPFPQEDVSCEKGSPYQCAWPEQIFVNGEPLEQVASNPNAGEFAVDDQRRVVLGEDPSGHAIEVTVRRHLITGTPSADNVTIENIDGRHAATEWRCGAIQSRQPTDSGSICRKKGDGDGWKLLNSEVSHVHGALVSIRSNNAELRGNHLHHAGQLGIHNPGDGSVVANNVVEHNNTEHYCIRPSTDYCDAVNTDGISGIQGGSPLTESGGIKIAGGKNFVKVLDNTFAHNYGNGIWYDVGANDATVTGNRTHHNARRGIFFEISKRALIDNNVVYENGWASVDHLNGAGIEVGNSDDVTVRNNTLAWNADNIAVRCSNRDPGDESTCEHIRVEDNVIVAQETSPTSDAFPGLALAWNGNSTLFASANANVGVGNDYWYSHSEDSHPRFAYGTKYTRLADFNASRGEEGGRYLSNSEKDAVLSSNGVPTTPER
jgi:parallel beta-helix repeat protein